MSRIYPLSIQVANQIAAGEVIERPASVVKELLENAMDSGADHISIDLGFGGLNHIKISDNGQGIVADDLLLAIAPHATSKLVKLEDLASLTSMGFRGEALASIASVCRLTLHSKPQDQTHGMILYADEAGVRMEACPRSTGTTVEVRDLFYNAPVRKGFLKSEKREYQAIEALVKRFALSALHVRLSLRHQGQLLLQLPAASCERTRLARIRTIFGKAFTDAALRVELSRSGMRLEGWISGAAHQRSTNDRQWIFLNGRMIKDQLIQHAVIQAYQEVLFPGRYPSCILYFTIPPQEVDVNVHPSKYEVRFLQSRLVHDFILLALENQLKDAVVPSKTSTDYERRSIQSVWQAPLREERHEPRPLCGDPPFFALNARFAVATLADQSIYLLDLVTLFEQYTRHTLENQPFPWPSRPLLVPVHYTLDHMAAFVTLLDQLGVRCALQTNGSWLILSIPLALPHLDLDAFLLTLSTTDAKEASVMNALIHSQVLDIRQWDGATQAEIIAFVQAHRATHASVQSACVVLDEARCHAMVHERS